MFTYIVFKCVQVEQERDVVMNCRIKQLVWHERERLKNQYWAEGVTIFAYEVFQKLGDERWCLLGIGTVDYFSNLSEAKAVAQAHYEQEVMKHLTTHPIKGESNEHI